MIGGLVRYERRLAQSLEKSAKNWRPLHEDAKFNIGGRRKKKFIAKTAWFKKRKGGWMSVKVVVVMRLGQQGKVLSWMRNRVHQRKRLLMMTRDQIGTEVDQTLSPILGYMSM